MSLQHKLSHWIYSILSYMPDFTHAPFFHDWISQTRALVLAWQPNKIIGKQVKIGRSCKISIQTTIKIGNGTILKDNISISGDFQIGEGSLIQAQTTIDASGKVRIGSKTQVGRNNTIFSHNHDISRKDIPVLESPEVFKEVEIGDDVMLFSRVAIMPGVHISNGVVVGYGSVVTSNLHAYGIYAGIPARQIGTRQ